MPYSRSLQAYTPPEFYREPPPNWERRLREISPVRPDMDHLVFRWFEPTDPDGTDRGWPQPDRGQWVLYTAKPIRLVEKERAKMFEKHWSELPEMEQEGRKSVVSSYQHFMWHARGLYVKPFLILQGEWGGTPAKYTEQEQAWLQASDCMADEFPIGMFPACPFDERTVKTIAMRDRMLQCANDVAEVARLDTPGAMKAETEAAQILKRQTHLDTFKVMIQPSVDFMEHWLRRSEHREQLPPAPPSEAKQISMWKDHWLQHGSVIGAGPAHQRMIR